MFTRTLITLSGRRVVYLEICHPVLMNKIDFTYKNLHTFRYCIKGEKIVPTKTTNPFDALHDEIHVVKCVSLMPRTTQYQPNNSATGKTQGVG